MGITDKLKKDIFPIFIVAAIVGMVIWMFIVGIPWGLILTMALLGIGFGIAELITKLIIGKTVSQQFWKWYTLTKDAPDAKYYFCPSCQKGFSFPNKWKGQVFSILFITTIVIITVGHLLWK